MTEVDFNIFEAAPEDAVALLDVQKKAFMQEAERYNAFRMPPLTESVEDVVEAFGEGTLLKAVADGRIVGVIRSREAGGTCHIGRLAVDPAYQDSGIGSALVQAVEAGCPDARRIELFVGSRSEKNIHVYEKLGYRAFKERRLRPGLALVYMQKEPEAPARPS